jgi:hypothetical protein
MRLATLALLVTAALATSACASEDDQHPGSAPAGAAPNTMPTFRACGVPSGGFRVRASGLPCSAASRAVGHFRAVKQVREFRFRDPSTRPVRVSREVVWRAAHGWTCLTQALPRVRVTQFLCVRGEQVLLWRAA